MVFTPTIKYENGIKYMEETLTWPQIKEIVDANLLESFCRSKEEAQRYTDFRIKNFSNSPNTVYKQLVAEKLCWAPKEVQNDPNITDGDIKVTPKSQLLFHDPSDVKISLNDFSYSFEKSVTHFVVWTKVPIPDDKDTELGDISPKTRELINLYVKKTFVDWLGLEEDDVTWFRNWSALQSLKLLSHIHVICHNISKEQIEKALYGPGVVLTKEEVESFNKEF